MSKALKNVCPIFQEEVPETLKKLFIFLKEELCIPYGKRVLIGSAGKKGKRELSSDIDIAIDVDHFINAHNINKSEIYDKFKSILTKTYLTTDIYVNRGLGVVSFPFPISITIPRMYVQVDIMLSDDLEFSKFSYNSPEESSYKGAHRNILLNSIAANIERRIVLSDQFNNIIQYEKYCFDIREGIKRITKSKNGKTKILKNWKTINKRLVNGGKIPENIKDMLLGRSFSLDDLNSFESIYRCINHKEFIYSDKAKEILKKATKDINHCKLNLPNELRNV